MKFPGLPVGNVRAYVKDNFNDFTLSNVVIFLKTYFNISEQDILILTLNIDEFQKHISEEDRKFLLTDLRDKSQLFIRKLSSSVMQLCMQLVGFDIFLIPVFSGTLSLKFLRIFPATDYRIVAITPSPLSLEFSMELVLNKFPEAFIGTLGGIPRVIEHLNYIIRDHSDLVERPNLLFKALVNRICDLYSISGFSISTQILRMILRFSISGKHVRRNERVGSVLIGELEGDGFFFLRSQRIF